MERPPFPDKDDRTENREKSSNPAAPINIERLIEVTDGDRDAIRELLVIFLEDAEARLEAIEVALAAGDAETLGAEAHSLKGAAGNVGADPMHQLAETLEDEARANRLDDGRATLNEMREQWTRVCDFAETHDGEAAA